MPVSLGLVTASMIMPPSRVSRLLSAMERFTPAMDCTSVVSVVSRDSTSPVRVTSKKAGPMRTTRW